MNRELPRQKFYLDEHGREMPDPTPIAPPVGYNRQPSLAEQIRAMVRSERLRQEAEAQGFETFEEADDFDVGDDLDPSSPYEEVFDPLPDPPAEVPASPPSEAASETQPEGHPVAPPPGKAGSETREPST